MVVSDYLKFAAELRGMNKHDIKRRMPEVLELTALSKVADEVINTLSHGYRQRVGVGQAIIHQPTLILDEPTRSIQCKSSRCAT